MSTKTAIAAAALIATVPVFATSAAQAHDLYITDYKYEIAARFAGRPANLPPPAIYKRSHSHDVLPAKKITKKKAKNKNKRVAHRKPHQCVAVAKKRRGTGKRIDSTRRVGNAFKMPKACDRAFRKCDASLNLRQTKGKNRRAACVIVRRIRH